MPGNLYISLFLQTIIGTNKNLQKIFSIPEFKAMAMHNLN